MKNEILETVKDISWLAFIGSAFLAFWVATPAQSEVSTEETPKMWEIREKQNALIREYSVLNKQIKTLEKFRMGRSCDSSVDNRIYNSYENYRAWYINDRVCKGISIEITRRNSTIRKINNQFDTLSGDYKQEIFRLFNRDEEEIIQEADHQIERLRDIVQHVK